MNTNVTPEEQMIINQVVPAYARVLNAVYTAVFEPINRVLSYFESSNTQRMVAKFEADEARAAARKQGV